MALHLIEPPAALPLDVEALRLHCRIDGPDEDSLLGIYQGAAVEFAEHATSRQIIAAKWRCILDWLPRGRYCEPAMIRLPIAPLIDVDAIYYINPAGQEQTLDPAEYVVSGAHEPARITPASGRCWPDVLTQVGAAWIDFWAGYCAPCVASIADDTLTVSGWPPLEVGEVVRLSNSGGALPAPLQDRRDYFIAEVVAEGVYTLANTSGGDPINLTSLGTGAHFLGQPGLGHSGAVPDGLRNWMLLRIAGLYEMRAEQVTIRGGNLAPVAFADRLLDPYRLPQI